MNRLLFLALAALALLSPRSLAQTTRLLFGNETLVTSPVDPALVLPGPALSPLDACLVLQAQIEARVDATAIHLESTAGGFRIWWSISSGSDYDEGELNVTFGPNSVHVGLTWDWRIGAVSRNNAWECEWKPGMVDWFSHLVRDHALPNGNHHVQSETILYRSNQGGQSPQ